jgi:hypothetical protein
MAKNLNIGPNHNDTICAVSRKSEENRKIINALNKNPGCSENRITQRNSNLL